MSELLKNIDARTRLAGTNKLEILLFTLGVDARSGCRETYGINVFKVREVMRRPTITAAPDMPDAVQGMVSLRGALVPVVDLGRYVGVGDDAAREIMIVTEYNGHTQGFLVEGVDTILRLDWSQMRVPPEMLTANLGGLVTAVTELPGPKLVMLLDVEKVLSETTRYDDEFLFNPDLRDYARMRVIVNAMTRMRFCTLDGQMDFKVKGEVTKAPKGYVPWFEVPGRKSADTTVVFGHWSALGLRVEPRLLALDSGCLWGRELSAVRLEDRAVFQVACPGLSHGKVKPS